MDANGVGLDTHLIGLETCVSVPQIEYEYHCECGHRWIGYQGDYQCELCGNTDTFKFAGGNQ